MGTVVARLIAVSLCLSAAFLACHGKDDPNDGPAATTYVVGFENFHGAWESTSRLWVNGKNRPYWDDAVEPESIFVSGDNIYVAGSEELRRDPWSGELVGVNRFYATLWKNGVPTRLESSGRYILSYANSVFVHNSDEYVAGNECEWWYDGVGTFTYKSIARLWVNGVGTTLESGDDVADAYSVFVSGNGDVYVAGRIFSLWKDGLNYAVATLWKRRNGELGFEPIRLGGTDVPSSVSSIFVSGDNVYVAGGEGWGYGKWDDRATLWKNGEPIVLGREERWPTFAMSVFVEGDDVYVAGMGTDPNTHNDTGRLWKNGVERVFTDRNNDAYIYSLFVLDGNWYVAGIETNGSRKWEATLWKNGAAQRLATGTGAPHDSSAKAVFVTRAE